LADIKEFYEKIERYIEGVSEENFRANEILQDALVRNIEIIGEAAKNLSDETRRENAAVPWRDANAGQNCSSLFPFKSGNNLANRNRRRSRAEVADK